MTNPTIPPCPVCGVVPVKHAKNDRILLCGCFEEYGAMMADVVSLQKYQLMCVDMLGRACRELGIETVEQLKARLATDPRVAVLEKKLAKLTYKLEMVEQESDQRLSAIISYSDQLLAMKEKYEPASQSEPHPDGCFSSYMNDVQDCDTDGHYSCKDCKRNSLIAAQRGEGV